MSFIQSAFADQPLRTREQVMDVIVEVADELDMPDKRGACVCAGMCVAREAGSDQDDDDIPEFWCPANRADPESFDYPHDSEGDDGRSVGYFQQQKSSTGALWWGPTSSEMDLHSACTEFMKRLKKNGYNASNARTANDSVQRVQQSGRPDAYAEFWQLANDVYNNVVRSKPQPQPGAPMTNRPDFNEIDQIGWDAVNPHGSTRTRPPINWFIHTQEGDGNAETLASFLRSTSGAGAVSYHYTIHEDPNDHGVTVCDVIDTDLYSWSVLNANVFSINACFAGSRAAYSRDQWLAKYRNAIRVVAYLAVEDAKKYTGISTNVIVPPYNIKGPGISDHKYVTQALGIGNHTDVGNNFPWDVFVGDVNSFVTPLEPTGPTAPPPVIDTTPVFAYPTTDLMTRQMWEQFFGPKGEGWPTLFGKTGDGKRGKYPVEALSDLHKEI